ncbi:NAD(P)-dependent dehydrogenase (short-subunit alcohol dehydrogenase family) [Arthrobacter pigmenti]|uniref:NAD(P)-dependent dehydrogenase (Short-subunit alcohol dehydrogenase family) n=1 Tax=Arthrobacter pigmenti TaxID=271432 RepID=A0A846RPA6_9MICC|nr:NAD(P)-dependent dehydrogenase (short-subunit alcohol dehydrogenase family) [Arthrobacter pigmenti]
MLDLFSLQGRRALVTGGTGPLGRVLCDALAGLGADVVVSDLDQDLCDQFATELAEKHGIFASGLATNLLDDDGASRLARAVTGSLDVLINNAAFTGTANIPGYAVPFEEQSDEAFMLATKLNLQVPFTLTRMLAPQLRESGHGSVINVSSIYGLVGPNMGLYEGTQMGNPAAYGATKGGVVQLTRYLSTVLAPGIRVNAFAPGGIARGQAEEFTERYEKLTPLRRMATEDDFRGVVMWLASSASRYVTGQTIPVDGGWSAW